MKAFIPQGFSEGRTNWGKIGETRFEKIITIRQQSGGLGIPGNQQ